MGEDPLPGYPERVSSHQGFDDLATRRRAPGGAPAGQQPPAAGGFGTQSQWRRTAPGSNRPQFTAPQPYGAQPGPGAQPSSGAQFDPRTSGPYSSQFQAQGFQSAPHQQQPWAAGGQYPPGQYPNQFPQAPQQWQYPQAPYPPQPPQRKSVLPVVLVCIVSVVAVLGVVSQLANRGKGPDDPGTHYQHDDYKVPPAVAQHPALPVPTSEAEVTQLLEKNPFYDRSVAKPVRCELEDFDHTTATTGEKKVQLEKTLECLVRVWGPTVEDAGFTITHPTVTMYDAPIQGACGKGKTAMRNAFYCNNDQNLYFASNVHEIFGPKANDPWAYEAVMAHEYGHALQGRTGIIPARNKLLETETSKEAAYLLVRRTEAQADCLAGLFFNSVQESMGLTPEEVTSIQAFYGEIGNKDPSRVSTHPQPPTRFKWFQNGMDETTIATCNSFVVTPDEVK